MNSISYYIKKLYAIPFLIKKKKEKNYILFNKKQLYDKL